MNEGAPVLSLLTGGAKAMFQYRYWKIFHGVLSTP
jgi:hypothetical protein